VDAPALHARARIDPARSARRSLEVIGVSRLARVGALDRVIFRRLRNRPRGHILQVCGGKGLTDSDAAWSAR
jgi:ribosomal protein S12 methylthiotransferase accessory factor YcaO